MKKKKVQMDAREKKHQAKLRAIEREGWKKWEQMWRRIMKAFAPDPKPRKKKESN